MENHENSAAVLPQYVEKINSLVSNWKKFVDLFNFSPDTMNFGCKPDESIINQMFRETAILILDTEWLKLDDHPKNELSFLINSIAKLIDDDKSKNLKVLVNLIKNSWNNPVLQKILNSKNSVTEEEVLSIVQSDGMTLLELRLEVLIKSGLSYEALELARILYSHASHLITSNIIDYYLILLYDTAEHLKRKRPLKRRYQNEITRLKQEFRDKVLGNMKIHDIKEVITRHSSPKFPSFQRLIIAEIAAWYLMKLVVGQEDASKDLVVSVTSAWLILTEENAWKPVIDDIIMNHALPQHKYSMCQAIYQQHGVQSRDLCLHYLIRILNHDQNLFIEDLASQSVSENDTEVLLTNQRRSQGFLLLATIFKFNIKIYNEILLTAFSIYPTDHIYSLIKQAALTVYQDPNHNNISQSSDNQNLDSVDCSELGITLELLKDLIIIIKSSRWHELTWSLNWNNLKSLCQQFLKNPNETRITIKELKHLHLDYSLFKNTPKKKDYHIGYEKAYMPKSKKVHNIQIPVVRQEEEKIVTRTNPDKTSIKCSTIPVDKQKESKIKNEILTCDLCFKKFKHPKTFQHHVIKYHGDENEIYKSQSLAKKPKQLKQEHITCDVCSRLFKNDQTLITHMTKFHATPLKETQIVSLKRIPDGEKKNYKCNLKQRTKTGLQSCTPKLSSANTKTVSTQTPIRTSHNKIVACTFKKLGFVPSFLPKDDTVKPNIKSVGPSNWSSYLNGKKVKIQLKKLQLSGNLVQAKEKDVKISVHKNTRQCSVHLKRLEVPVKMKQQHKSDYIRCKFCLKPFKNIYYHYAYYHWEAEEREKLKCNFCSKEFRRECVLIKHIQVCRKLK